MTKPRAPRGLNARARRFWSDLHEVYDFDRDELELLVQVVRTLHEVDALQTLLAAEGPMTIGSRGQVVEHPAGVALRAHRLVLSRLLRQLALPDLSAPAAEPQPFSQQRRAAQSRWDGRKGRGA